MKTDVKEVEGIKIIKLVGDLNGKWSGEVRDKIIALIDSNSKMVFDMSECNYISSAGLRTLLIIAKKLKSLDSYGVLADLGEEVKDIMDMTGFSHILDSYDRVDQAIDYLTRERKRKCACR
ncbi:STAS domain-containing protein [Halonatronum saccharophilum]|uniref:STAS domain-containing protein n=1 Tax=Halonatronum saccharophilum TaxID=150060 RepID=UPI0004B87B49|nr:STAS domain-containing protein [Halonatronum saccharophilum]